MGNLRELYQEMILDHQKNPRHHYALSHPTSQANGFNRLCGDRLTVYLKIKDQLIQDISFVGCGCAISQASASLMTEALHGLHVPEAQHVFEDFHAMLTNNEAQPVTGKLSVLSGVRLVPARVKCATLAWHTMIAALKNESTTVVTE